MAMAAYGVTGAGGADIHYAGAKLPYGIGTDAKGKLTVAGVDIYPTSLSAQSDGEMKEYKGPAGVTIAIVSPAQFMTVSGDGWVATNDGTVNVSNVIKGASVTMSGDTMSKLGITSDNQDHFRLESFSVQFSNEDAAKVSFTIKEYPAIAKDSGSTTGS